MVEVTSSVWALNSPDWSSEVAVTLSSIEVISMRASFGLRAEEVLVRLEHQLAAVEVDAVSLNGPE